MAKILSGRELSSRMREEMKQEIVDLRDKYDIVPGLAVILIGDDPGSLSYVRNKEKACASIGLVSRKYEFGADYPEADVLKLIDELNQDKTIHGILVQLPLPDHISEDKVISAIEPDKDVDGFHPINIGKMMVGSPNFLPCTPYGIQQLLLRNNIEIEGSHVVIVGRSNIVGKPLAMILVQKKPGGNATVTLCHTRTRNMGDITKSADILVLAAGKPNSVTADMIKQGAVVIIVGQTWIEDKTRKSGHRVVGDVDFDEASAKASAITPVTGGVGPMTITMLLNNTIQSAKRYAGIE
ncbi:MAG: bifunctional methylenetetrahydrofolate dehydrogenase/methenyltetrahydrofolate cyclohydrolase FolD [bacterium]